MSQPPWDPYGQQGQEPYPGEQYGPSGPQPPQVPSQPPPGWYPDPGGQQVRRWWDGTQWAPHTQPLADPRPGPVPYDVASGPAAQPQPGPRHGIPAQAGHGPRKSWPRRHKASTAIFGAAALLVLLIIIAGVTGGGGTGAADTPAAAPSSAGAVAAANSAAAAASSAAAAASSAAAAPCTSNSCIVTELDQSLKGDIAQDESVATKVDCSSSSVKNEGGGTWTAWCTVYYSDGTSAEGYGNLDTSQNKVTFEPSD